MNNYATTLIIFQQTKWWTKEKDKEEDSHQAESGNCSQGFHTT